MSLLEILDIILVALCVLAYAAKIYFKVRGNVLEAVSELIALAETSGLAGSEKMAQVVDALSERVPVCLKAVLSKPVLQDLAQGVFDWMRRYAVTYAEVTASADSEEERSELVQQAAKQLTTEAAAQMIVELLGLTQNALMLKAHAYGVDVDPSSSKKEIVQAIVTAIMNKA